MRHSGWSCPSGSAVPGPSLQQESLALLFTSQKTSDGQETNYGIGWTIGKSKSGKTIYEHGGGSVGGTAQLILYPDTRVVVAFVCNFASEDGAGLKREDVEKIGEALERRR